MIKYLWSAAGYCLISIPVLLTRRRRSLGVQTMKPGASEETDDVVANRTESAFNHNTILFSNEMKLIRTVME